MNIEFGPIVGIEDDWISHEATPEQRLWIAVIIHARYDAGKIRTRLKKYASKVDMTGKTPPYYFGHSIENKFLAAVGDAERLLTEVRHPYFEIVCENAGASHRAVVEKIEGLFAEGLALAKTEYYQRCYQARASMIRRPHKSIPR